MSRMRDHPSCDGWPPPASCAHQGAGQAGAGIQGAHDMTIKRIASLFAVAAAIAAVPAAAPSTFASIAPTAAFADCKIDGAPIACEPGPGDSCDPNCEPLPKPCGSESSLVSRY